MSTDYSLLYYNTFASYYMYYRNQTNNFVELQFLVLKDVILKRMKGFNVVALIGRLTTDWERSYCRLQMVVLVGHSECTSWERKN